jgi:hypothetical protein
MVSVETVEVVPGTEIAVFVENVEVLPGTYNIMRHQIILKSRQEFSVLAVSVETVEVVPGTDNESPPILDYSKRKEGGAPPGR